LITRQEAIRLDETKTNSKLKTTDSNLESGERGIQTLAWWGGGGWCTSPVSSSPRIIHHGECVCWNLDQINSPRGIKTKRGRKSVHSKHAKTGWDSANGNRFTSIVGPWQFHPMHWCSCRGTRGNTVHGAVWCFF